MSNLILNKINNQINSLKIKTNKRQIINYIAPKIASPPIESEQLRKILIMETSENKEIKKEDFLLKEIMFNGIQEFVSWYELNKEKFTMPQQEALNTLVMAKKMINTGCSCQRITRISQAEGYFKNFWINNIKTDLPEMIFGIMGNKYQIFSEGKIILEWPTR